MLADKIFGNLYTLDDPNLSPASNFTHEWAYLYSIVFTLFMLVLGAWYYRRREFN